MESDSKEGEIVPQTLLAKEVEERDFHTSQELDKENIPLEEYPNMMGKKPNQDGEKECMPNSITKKDISKDLKPKRTPSPLLFLGKGKRLNIPKLKNP